jgi:hypothetical protein
MIYIWILEVKTMDKPKFNLLDGIIIVAVVLVAVVAVYFFKGSAKDMKNEASNVLAEYTIQLTEADEGLYQKFMTAQEGNETVFLGVKERFEGKITGLELIPAQKITTDTKNGTAVLAEDPTNSFLNITVASEAVETESSISVSGTAIRVGEELVIAAKNCAGCGYVIDLKTKTE